MAPPRPVRVDPPAPGWAASSVARPALVPLSHHEILALAAPFARAGWRVDLPASDRAARRIALRPPAAGAAGGVGDPGRGHAGGGADAGVSGTGGGDGGSHTFTGPVWVGEALELDAAEPRRLRLSRTLRPPAGPAAVLVAEGADAAALLAAVLAVPPERQFMAGAGWHAALQQRLTAPGEPVLVGAEAALPAGLVLRMKVSPVRGFPAEFEILRQPPRAAAEGPALPDDLLSVLGWGWDRLTPLPRGWTGAASLPKDEPARSAAAAQRFMTAAQHLATTLAEPPARYHQRHRARRWAVAARRTLPLWVGGGAIAAGFAAQRQGAEGGSMLALLANVAPPLLLGLFFLQREMPRIELPRLPRAPRPDAWPPAGPAGPRAPATPADP